MISVIVPVYNSCAYLKNCIDSILRQTYSDLEIICVNDGSTDGSLRILKELEQQDSRIIVLSQDNAGVAAARNAGLEIAQGEYVAFVDSDDELQPDMYEVLINLAQENGSDITHCGYRKMYLDGTSKDICGTGQLLVQTADEAICCLLAGERFVSGLWNKLYRTNAIADIRFDTQLKINEDTLFNVQAFRRAEKTVFIDLPKYLYFERENSACARTASIKKKQDSVKAAEQILALLRNSAPETVAAQRLHYCLTDLYRAYLFEGIRKNRSVCDKLHGKICETALLIRTNSRRSQINYAFMRAMPMVYKAVYSVYDYIRKPNWDL